VDVTRGVDEIRAITDAARSAEETVGLVPTMGALHEGHASVIGDAREHVGTLVVSIFVNPLQFSDTADLEAYPRDEDRDLAVCDELGVDAVWAPPPDEVYPPGVVLPSPDPGPVGRLFEGAFRPGHFDGVLKLVHRLFDVIGPCAASFGEKDAQQLFLVRHMVESERLPVRVVAHPTVREPDGLAASSRNVRLSPAERDQAASLFLGLSEGATRARGGERDAHAVRAAIAREIGATPLARLDYAEVVDDATFLPLDELEPGISARAIVAARFSNARLIDNLVLPSPPAWNDGPEATTWDDGPGGRPATEGGP
jgi:pantoate--beta-alanine ligase